MARKRTHRRLTVLLNDRDMGVYEREANGAVHFTYRSDWLDWQHAIPVSLSLPLRESRYSGTPVTTVFENLLPDSEPDRRRLAESHGASGTDAFSLLSEIGRDCVGALQFLPVDQPPIPTTLIDASPISDQSIEALLANLTQSPLGLDPDTDEEFRISVAGAQAKTALLKHEGKWMKPHGTTPTTHIFKPQIGRLPNGPDLSDSVENEFFCLQLLNAFSLAVNEASMERFGDRKVLVVQRFDRRMSRNGRLIRLPQEDFCQALSVPSSRKYQAAGGPGIADIMQLLAGSDEPTNDRRAFFMSQVLFWLISATDGHAKNYSLFLRDRGGYRLTPFYDVLTLQPYVDHAQVQRKFLKLSMSVGERPNYRIPYITKAHFQATARKVGFPKKQFDQLLDEISGRATESWNEVLAGLPDDFPEYIHECTKAAFDSRLRQLASQP